MYVIHSTDTNMLLRRKNNFRMQYVRRDEKRVQTCFLICLFVYFLEMSYFRSCYFRFISGSAGSHFHDVMEEIFFCFIIHSLCPAYKKFSRLYLSAGFIHIIHPPLIVYVSNVEQVLASVLIKCTIVSAF